MTNKCLIASKVFLSLAVRIKLTAKELSIKLITVNRTRRSVEVIAKNSLISHHAEDQLRLLNDLFPVGEPKLGDLIKIVR